MGTLWPDIPFELSMLRKTPGWTILALLTFPLGTGGSTPIFSVDSDVPPRTLPGAESEELLSLAGSSATMPKRLSGKSILASQFFT